MKKFKVEPMFGPNFKIIEITTDENIVLDIESQDEAIKKCEEMNAESERP